MSLGLSHFVPLLYRVYTGSRKESSLIVDVMGRGEEKDTTWKLPSLTLLPYLLAFTACSPTFPCLGVHPSRRGTHLPSHLKLHTPSAHPRPLSLLRIFEHHLQSSSSLAISSIIMSRTPDNSITNASIVLSLDSTIYSSAQNSRSAIFPAARRTSDLYTNLRKTISRRNAPTSRKGGRHAVSCSRFLPL